MNLLLDIGNTRAKWCLLSNVKLAAGRESAANHLVHALDWNEMAEKMVTSFGCDDVNVTHIYIASVVGDLQVAITQALVGCFGCEVVFVKSEYEQLGVTNGYEDCSKLGVDRWMALLAAFHYYDKAVCVIDCGSAITIDGLRQSGEHIGGFILPGMDMMEDTLLANTRAVRYKKRIRVTSEQWAKNTVNAVQGGVVFSVLAMAKEAVVQLKSLLGEDVVLCVTGGDGLLIRDALGADYCADLVLDGLALVVDA